LHTEAGDGEGTAGIEFKLMELPAENNN